MTTLPLDTTPDADAVYRRALQSFTPEQRLKMATQMWSTARRLVQSSLREQGITDPLELKVQTFLRIYASDFDQPTLNDIAARLRAAG